MKSIFDAINATDAELPRVIVVGYDEEEITARRLIEEANRPPVVRSIYPSAPSTDWTTLYFAFLFGIVAAALYVKYVRTANQ